MTSDEGVILGLVSFFFPVRRHVKPKISWYFTSQRFTCPDIRSKSDPTPSCLYVLHMLYSAAAELSMCVSFWLLEFFERNFKRAFYQYLLTIDTSNQQLSSILIIATAQRRRQRRVSLFPVRWYENPEISCYFTTKRYSCRDIRQEIILHVLSPRHNEECYFFLCAGLKTPK